MVTRAYRVWCEAVIRCGERLPAVRRPLRRSEVELARRQVEGEAGLPYDVSTVM
ncbi:hypothetical protein [Streptomyces sp. NBC_00280]|uniref:hypothetical protein n=1 Tax=Streptomyces sp. NBC_00280 TaxID=2975699 RepID=UPI003245BD6F